MDFIIDGLAGAGATIITNPMDVVKTRMQLQGEVISTTEAATKYRGVCHALYVIARTDGVLALQQGLAPAMVFGFTMNSVRVKEGLKSRGYCENFPEIRVVIASLVSGVVCAIVITPLDVVNTRLYNQGPASEGAPHYTGVLDCLTKIYRTEGFHGLYKGIAPMFMMVAPHIIMSLVIWDVLNNL